MNDIKYLELPLLVPPAGFLPSKGDCISVTYQLGREVVQVQGARLQGCRSKDQIHIKELSKSVNRSEEAHWGPEQ